MIDILKELNLDLDFSKLKLPYEPKELIMLYLAYKLINNIDRVDFNSLLNLKPELPIRHINNIPIPSISNLRPIVGKSNNFQISIFIFVLALVGFIFFNIILDNINISIDTFDINLNNRKPQLNSSCRTYSKNNYDNLNKCPMFNTDNLNKCPMFNNDNLKKCPMFNNDNLKKCPKKNYGNNEIVNEEIKK